METNRQLYEGLLQKLKEAGVMTGLRSSNVRIVDPASAPTAPSSPNIPRNLMISLLVGLAGGVSLAFILESRDNTVHSLEQAQMITALPSLAVIPLATRASRSLAAQVNRQPQPQPSVAGRAEIADCGGLSGAADFHPAFQDRQVGQGPDGHQRAAAGRQDHDQRQSGHRAGAARRASAPDRSRHATLGISEVFAFKSDIGLSTVLAQRHLRGIRPASIPGVPNLSVLPAGPVPINPSEMLASSRMRDLLTA